jgi:hypothetical protein
MKQFFRFFRGELNGFFLYRMVTFLNNAIDDIKDEMVYQANMQWKLDSEVSAGETPIREEDIFNLGKIAGLFQPRSYGRVSLGSIALTQRYPPEGPSRSERGLLDMTNEGFKFVRLTHDEYPDDIVTEASPDMRMGHIPEGRAPVGYVYLGEYIYTNDGEIIWENVHPAPPEDNTPYAPFYGESFLVHEEYFDRETPLTVDIYKLLLECVMRIRFNGPTVAEFLTVTEILGAGYIHDITIVPQGVYFILKYHLNDDLEVFNRARRYAAWQDICKQKFKKFKLEQQF